MHQITRRTAFAFGCLTAVPARAQAFPTRPVTWVVPAAAGGVLDVGARLIAQKMAAALGQPVVIENRVGGGNAVGIEHVTRAAPDGYTMVYGTFNGLAVAPLLIPGLRYDPVADLLPVRGLAAAANLLVCGSDRPFRSVRELVETARARPEALSYASTGVGSGQHLAGALFCRVAGVRMTHVPYNAFAQAANDMMAGRIDVMFDYALSSMPHVRAGRLRAMAVTSEERLAAAPDVPTIGEAGLPGAELLGWAGLYVPARTPLPAIEALSAAALTAMRDPEVRALFDSTGTLVWADKDGPAMARILAEEQARMRELVPRSGAREG